MLSAVRTLLRWEPLAVGKPAPNLSLTADEGTWVRLPEFKGHLHVVLLFFKALDDDKTDAWLKDFQHARPGFEELETAIFAVSTHNTDKLRHYRNELGLDFYLLHDAFALGSRPFRASGRVRPYCKPTCVVVGKDGHIAYSTRGMPAAAEILDVVARMEGKAPPSLDGKGGPSWGFSAVRNPGQEADRVHEIDGAKAVELLAKTDQNYVLVDVRTKGEFESGHSPVARHIPVDEVPHRYQELGQTTSVIFVCGSGGRSAQAAEFLVSIGCSDIYNVVGGMAGWPGEQVKGPAPAVRSEH